MSPTKWILVVKHKIKTWNFLSLFGYSSFHPAAIYAGLTLLRELLITWAASDMETVAVWSTLCSKWNTKCAVPWLYLCYVVVDTWILSPPVDTCAKSPLVDTCVIPIGTCWHVCYISTCWHVCEVRARVGLARSRRNLSRCAHCSTQISRQEMVVRRSLSRGAPQHWAGALLRTSVRCSGLYLSLF